MTVSSCKWFAISSQSLYTACVGESHLQITSSTEQKQGQKAAPAAVETPSWRYSKSPLHADEETSKREVSLKTFLSSHKMLAWPHI